MSQPQDWTSAAVTAAIAVVTAIWWAVRKLFISVTREELERHLDRLREERRQMHGENVARFNQVQDGVASVQSRIDDLYRDIFNREPPRRD